MISYTTENVKVSKLERRKINAWIKSVAAGYGKKIGEIAYIFCDDAKILEINRTYLQHDYYTDIITFDYCEGDMLHGDIFISIDMVRFNAQKFGVDFDNELHRVLIHGILHLCGQDDKTPKAKAIMTEKENLALAMLEK